MTTRILHICIRHTFKIVKPYMVLGAGAPEGGAAGAALKWLGLAATVVVTVLITRTAKRALAEAAPEVLEQRSGGAEV